MDTITDLELRFGKVDLAFPLNAKVKVTGGNEFPIGGIPVHLEGATVNQLLSKALKTVVIDTQASIRNAATDKDGNYRGAGHVQAFIKGLRDKGIVCRLFGAGEVLTTEEMRKQVLSTEEEAKKTLAALKAQFPDLEVD